MYEASFFVMRISMYLFSHKRRDIMDIIVERGAGLDVHKETVVACIMGTGIKRRYGPSAP